MDIDKTLFQMNNIKFIRINLYAKTCSRLFSSINFSRRDLSPLIKCIHPDMFAQESKLIQSTNLKCLQVLNEMFDSIEYLQLQKGIDYHYQYTT